MKLFFSLLFCLFTILPFQTKVSFADDAVTLFYSNNMHGETEPCG